MATLTVQEIKFGTLAAGKYPGKTVSFAAATVTGDEFVNDGNTTLRVKNGSGAPITVTVTQQRADDEGLMQNCVFDVAAAGEVEIGRFSSLFNDANGKCQVTYSGVSSLTVAAVKVADRGRG